VTTAGQMGWHRLRNGKLLSTAAGQFDVMLTVDQNLRHQQNLTNLPLAVIVEHALDIFVREIYGTHRKQVLRLIISEGPRFPALAEFYYREVLAHILKAVRARLARAVERGEIAGDELVRFPQLLGAPGIVAIVWSGLFDRFEPLDVRAMMRAYFDRLFGPRSPP